MNRFLVLLFFIFQTPILQASDCKDEFRGKNQEATQALSEELSSVNKPDFNETKRPTEEEGADVNTRGREPDMATDMATALLRASEHVHKELIKSLKGWLW